MKKTDISDHTFGGDWTEEKLARVREYLTRYRQVFKKQTFLRTWYVDGFAGTGTRADREASPEQSSTTDHLFEDVYDDNETNTFRQGSATIALGLDDPFDRYCSSISGKDTLTRWLRRSKSLTLPSSNAVSSGAVTLMRF